MRAAVLRRPGGELGIEDLDLEEPKRGEVLVRVTAAGVCHTDLHYLRGGMPCRLPIVPGHEGAAVVEAVGPEVSRFQRGDEVILMWRPRCGHCAYCASGRPAMCATGRINKESGGLLDGTTRLRAGSERVHHLLGVACFAEQAVVPQEALVHIPRGTPPQIAAMVGCAVITGVGAVLNVMGEVAGRPCLVVGAGGVGLSAIMGARMAGAYPIIATDVSPEKLELAQRLGATHGIDPADGPLEDQVDDVVAGGVPWAFEAVGKPATVQAAMRALSPGGTAVAVGLGAVEDVVSVPLNDLVQREKHLVGSLYGSANTVIQIPRLLELHAAGQLPLHLLLGQTYPLEKINEAYAALAAGSVGRSVVLPGDSQ